MSKGRSAPQDGGHNPNAKLTEKNVKEIRRLDKQGVSRRELATRFDTSLSNIYLVVNGKTWKNV